MPQSEFPDRLHHRVRLATIDLLENETARHGDVLPHSVLRRGSTFDDHRDDVDPRLAVKRHAPLIVPISRSPRAFPVRLNRRIASAGVPLPLKWIDRER